MGRPLFWGPSPLSTVRQRVVRSVCGLGLLALLGAELMAPRDVTIGTAILIPVLVSAILLDRHTLVVITGMAIVTRVLAAAVGDITASLAALEAAVYAVAAGTVLLLPPLHRQVTPQKASRDAAYPDQPGALSASNALTERERQVLYLTQRGLTAAQIGTRLFIGRRTVESHLHTAYTKVGVRSKRELIERGFDDASGGRVPDRDRRTSNPAFP